MIEGRNRHAVFSSAGDRGAALMLDRALRDKDPIAPGKAAAIAPQVSFVIPAFNAVQTLDRTLRALADQTVASWEAVVVDDGSTDATVQLVEAAHVRDPRIRLISQPNAGVSAARNTGIEAASGDWLVFLDSDDWIAPQYLQVMQEAIRNNPGVEVACCGHARTDADGRHVLLRCVPNFEGDPFACFARKAMGTIHSFMVRHTIVQDVGGFDPALRTCEDWDLFQRVFRTGARLAQTSEILAYYAGRVGSLSRDGARMMRDTRTVFLRGCTADPRVANSDPRYANGVVPPRSVEYTCLWIACWCTATAIGSGAAGTELLALVNDFSDVDHLDGAIFEGLTIGSGLLPDRLAAQWPTFEPRVRHLVHEIARRAGNSGGGRAIFEQLALRLASSGPTSRPYLVGNTLVATFSAAMLRRGVQVPPDVDSVVLRIGRRGRLLHMPVLGPLAASDLRAALVASLQANVPGAARRIAGRVARHHGRFGRAGPLIQRVVRRGLRAVAAASGQGACDHGVAEIPNSARAIALIHEERAQASDAIAGAASAQGSTGKGAPVEAAHFEHREAYWEGVFEVPDPWAYESPYEQLKYQRTLSLLPEGPIGSALELACAEGRFTALLAPRVGQLQAMDISRKAIERARERCRALRNVLFNRVDFFAEPVEGRWNLIVCSEVLYFLNDVIALRSMAGRLRDALAPGGYILAAHAKLLVDDRSQSGFEWNHEFGGATITRVLAETAGLEHIAGLRTELYNIDLFRRSTDGGVRATPMIAEAPLGPLPEPRAQRAIVWGGAIATRAECNLTRSTPDIPILMYHRIADGTDRFTVSPEQFELQLRFLRRRGFRSVSFDEWSSTARQAGRMAGRPLMLTFDDGTMDFKETAWPIIYRNGFSAAVFIPTDKVGGCADWAGAPQPAAAIMGWDEIIALSRQGVEFGSHLASHVSASRLTSEQLLREGARSKAVLEQALSRPIDTIALPYGVTNGRVRRVLRVCGYGAAFTAEYGVASSFGPMLDIPRIEISARDGLDEFARKLGLSGEC